MKLLSSPAHRKDPRNHTIPFLAFIDAGEWSFSVEACWGMIYEELDPSYQAKLEIAKQLLEGLSFMHHIHIAHGDIHPGNVMCNHENKLPNGKSGLKGYCSTFKFRVAYIDFDNSSEVDPNGRPITEICKGPPAKYAAPEQIKWRDDEMAYDMRAADVFNLGRVLQHVVNKNDDSVPLADKDALSLLVFQRLLDAMTNMNPEMRPRAREALRVICEILAFHSPPLQANPSHLS